MPRKLHIFGISSFISAVFCSIYAQTEIEGESEIVVILDQLGYKKEHKSAILKAIDLFPDHKLIDLSSDLDDTFVRIPSKSKEITRKYKTKPVIRYIYNFLLSIKTKRDHTRLLMLLKREFADKNIQVINQTQILSQPMHKAIEILPLVFKKASVAFCEHGLGDYIDIYESKRFDYPFVNLYAEEWKSLIHQEGESRQIFEIEEFHLAPFVQHFQPERDALKSLINGEQKVSLLILQALEAYSLSLDFWKAFLDQVMQKCEGILNNLVLIKPHPYQSEKVSLFICNYLNEKGVRYQIMDHPLLKTFSIEVLFEFIRENVTEVISPFSSSLFYLSKLHRHSEIKFYYNIQIALENYGPADLYRKRWQKLNEFLQHVFAVPNLIEV